MRFRSLLEEFRMVSEESETLDAFTWPEMSV